MNASNLTIAELLQVHARYEKLRRLNVPQFQDLLTRNLRGEGRFDDLVDRLPSATTACDPEPCEGNQHFPDFRNADGSCWCGATKTRATSDDVVMQKDERGTRLWIGGVQYVRRIDNGTWVPMTDAQKDIATDLAVPLRGELTKVEDEDGEKKWERGYRAAWRSIFGTCLAELSYEASEAEHAKWIVEREDAVRTLRMVCEEHGDNDWPNNLSLADVIDKHLGRHLDNA